MAQELIVEGKEGYNEKKGDKPLDTGYSALMPDSPTGKGGKNSEKLQPPALDDPFPPVIVEELAENGTAKQPTTKLR